MFIYPTPVVLAVFLWTRLPVSHMGKVTIHTGLGAVKLRGHLFYRAFDPEDTGLVQGGDALVTFGGGEPVGGHAQDIQLPADGSGGHLVGRARVFVFGGREETQAVLAGYIGKATQTILVRYAGKFLRVK